MNIPTVPSGGVYTPDGWTIIFLLLILWSFLWQGLALWHAAKRGEKRWFIFFLLVHTAGIIEIIYLRFIVHMPMRLPSSPKQ